MTRPLNSLLLVIALLTGSPAIAQSIFSHAVINIPEVRVNASWVEVIETQEEWNAFYLEHYGTATTSPAIPTIDFDTYRVVAGGLGFHASGGAMITIDRVHDVGSSVMVSGVIVRAGANCLVTQAVTWPTTAILIRQSAKPVQISMIPATYSCG